MKLINSLVALLATTLISSTQAQSNQTSTSNASLVIYTYPSLMGSTNAYNDSYDFIGAYANYSGLNYDDIVVIRLPSNDLAYDAVNYKSLNISYAPDVVIGMDSSEEIASPQIWLSFNLTNSSIINPRLQSLYNYDHAKPFDYDFIAVIYDIDKYPEMQAYNNSFTLQSLIVNNTVSNLTVANPLLDTSGLDFLLWSVAEFGDPSLNITGIYGNNTNITSWQDFWQSAFNHNITIVDTWDDAFNEFSDPTSNTSFIVSYGFDPAYNTCQDYDNTIVPLITIYNHTQYGYLAVEIISIVGNTTHRNQSINFVNWFVGNNNSEQIPFSQWSLPANINVQEPQCFINSDSISPFNNTNINVTQTVLYNDLLSNYTNLTEYINTWINQWEQIYLNYTNMTNSSNSSSTSSSTSLSSQKKKLFGNNINLRKRMSRLSSLLF